MSHFGDRRGKEGWRDNWYAASNAVAAWLGLYAWYDIARMREEDEPGLRKLLDEAP